MTRTSLTKLGTVVLSLAVLAGCSTTSPRQALKQENVGDRVAIVADAFVGVPYVWGGATPRGFDCSGLVFYTYSRVGVTVPRTTVEQFRHVRRVRLSGVKPGDLLFFRAPREGISHVGIYVGNMRFIHAPSSGKAVTYGDLRHDYWRDNFVTAGRPY